MIAEAEARGEIKPGDTLIEATSGNTGIALAMAAAIRGYRLILIMPSHMSEERKLAMAAYGAELLEVTQEEGMEGARDLAMQMQAEGEGRVLISDPLAASPEWVPVEVMQTRVTTGDARPLDARKLLARWLEDQSAD